MDEEKGDCKKSHRGSWGVNARINRASSGEIKNDMHGWTVDFRVDHKKKEK